MDPPLHRREKAFLQSDQIRRLVYASPPKGANVRMGRLWRLRVAAYGFADAAVDWYKAIKRNSDGEGIHEINMTHSLIYATNSFQQNIVLLALHVDDMIFAVDELFLLNKALYTVSTKPIEQETYISSDEKIRLKRQN